MTCTCKHVGDGMVMDSTDCVIHNIKPSYHCDHCDCDDYRPRREPIPGRMIWPRCVCGHAAQEHN